MKDGFLITCWIVRDFEKRWDDLRLQHQMYNAGHFFEMAVEHARLTGDPKVLNAARRFADHIDSIFGPGKRYDVDGHQEVELALVRLYRATGERRYLDLARFFLDERGYAHGTERKPFDPKSVVEPTLVKPTDRFPLTEEQRRANFQAKLRRRVRDILFRAPLSSGLSLSFWKWGSRTLRWVLGGSQTSSRTAGS